jgi:hypothetical protein
VHLAHARAASEPSGNADGASQSSQSVERRLRAVPPPEPEPPVTVTGVAEVVRLPGEGAVRSHRMTLDLASSISGSVTLLLSAVELRGIRGTVMPRSVVVAPGRDRLTVVVIGPVVEGALTLVYELEGVTHRSTTALPIRPSLG